MPERANTLVQWRGGGFEGCIWEPNTGFFDAEGKWHPIISTGCDRRDTLEEFLRKADPPFPGKDVTDENCGRVQRNNDIVYDITEGGLLEFQQNIRDDYFMHTLKALEKAGYDVFWKCSRCDKVQAGTDTFVEFSGYKGDGGIGIIHQGPVCYECHDKGACTMCNELRDETEIIHLDNGQYCKFCIDRAVDDKATPKEQDELEALDQDEARFRQQVEDYCALVPHAAATARKQLAASLAKLERRREKLLNVIIARL